MFKLVRFTSIFCLPGSSCSQYYTIAVGKLNPAKLANFMEVDIYVLVACPECSLHDFKVM